jgi:dTDP-4-amino-4,6-dideoxygalactose transaminase
MLNKDLSSLTELIPFNAPAWEHTEIQYTTEAIKSSHRHGAGPFTARAAAKLKAITDAEKILLAHSCTGALEMAMLLMEIKAGDEVILPSYTFSSSANSIVLRGAIPVFADIDARTQCLDPASVASLITDKTRAIMPVHYAGVGCDMSAIMAMAQEFQLFVIEDAAQTIGAKCHDKALGTFGDLGALSFHDSKNISSGEGGALLINNPSMLERAEILWEKGTNRSQFLRGEVDKYTWVDVGSSFLPSEITAAMLLSQLERMEIINQSRLKVWNHYYASFTSLEIEGNCMRPFVPEYCEHNAHIFYLMMNATESRNQLLQHLKARNIAATFHYVPLHDSPAGKKFGRAPQILPNTDRAGQCLIRLPLFPSLSREAQDKVIEAVFDFFAK